MGNVLDVAAKPSMYVVSHAAMFNLNLNHPLSLLEGLVHFIHGHNLTRN